MRILQLGRLGAGHIPVMFAIIFTAMLGITYCFAVWHGDVDPLFPYISNSGDNRPESCIFSMLLNLCALISATTVYLRYSLVVELNRSSDLTLKTVNRVVLYFGLVGALGMFVVANFQEGAVVWIHITAAIICFGSGCLFMLGQGWISHRMHPLFAGKRIAHIRTIIAVIGSICFVVSLGFGKYAGMVFHSVYPDLPVPRPWRHSDLPGFTYHCISAAAEWTLAILHMVYLLSFSREFEKIRVQLGVQPLVSHLDQSPLWQSIESLAPSP